MRPVQHAAGGAGHPGDEDDAGGGGGEAGSRLQIKKNADDADRSTRINADRNSILVSICVHPRFYPASSAFRFIAEPIAGTIQSSASRRSRNPAAAAPR